MRCLPAAEHVAEKARIVVDEKTEVLCRGDGDVIEGLGVVMERDSQEKLEARADGAVVLIACDLEGSVRAVVNALRLLGREAMRDGMLSKMHFMVRPHIRHMAKSVSAGVLSGSSELNMMTRSGIELLCTRQFSGREMQIELGEVSLLIAK
jgi:hypothetical protein